MRVVLLAFMLSSSGCAIGSVVEDVMFNPKESAQSTPGDEQFKKKMDSWLGQYDDSLVRSWGPPSDVYKLDDGSKILTYQYNGSVNTFANGNRNFAYATTYQSYCRIRFNTNAAGKIEEWRSEGRCF